MASSLKNISKPHRKGLLISAILCITLGIAPLGDPHIVGKWRWILGGANGMTPLDWFDTVMHSAPFLMLIYFTVKILKNKKPGPQSKQ